LAKRNISSAYRDSSPSSFVFQPSEQWLPPGLPAYSLFLTHPVKLLEATHSSIAHNVLLFWLNLSHNPALVLFFIYSSKIKVKVNLTLEQATKTHRGSKGIALLCL
jgi:hypothetical protein